MQYQQKKRFWKKHGGKVVAGGLTIVGLFLGRDDIASNMENNALIKQEVSARTARIGQLERQRAEEEKEAAIAEKRYEGCIPVVGEEYRNGKHYFVGLKQNQIIRDRITGKPLGKGIIVCDSFGLTGRINEEGRLTQVAFTGNRKLVTERTAHFVNQQFSLPVAGK